MRTCGQCKNFTDAGDWNLCCTKPPKKAKEYNLGFLCYANSLADDCENFELYREDRCHKCVYELKCAINQTINQIGRCKKYKRDAPDGGYYD